MSEPLAGESQQRLKLVIAYDGQEFSGSQSQPGKRTVQGELERAVSDLFGEATAVTLAGRTDSGVHAAGQVAACLDRRSDLANARIGMALRSSLPIDLSVGSVERRPAAFDPRRDATWRHYRYRIWNGPRNPLVRRQAAHIDRELDLAAMRIAAEAMPGERDFASFAGLGSGVPWAEKSGRGTIRRVWAVELQAHPGSLGRMLTVDVIGDAFLPGQVRSMIGALIEVGRGRMTPDWVPDLIASRDRRAGPKTAPAYGLTLMQVGYESFVNGRQYGTGDAEAETGVGSNGS